MITFQLDKSKLASQVKLVTTASDQDWGNTFRRAVDVIATAVAFLWTIGLLAKTAYKHPVHAFKEWTNPPTPSDVAAHVKERPATKPGSKPKPAAVTLITEKSSTPRTKKRTTRSRKTPSLGIA